MLNSFYRKTHLVPALLVLCMVLVLLSWIAVPARAALTDTNIGATVSSGADNSSISGNEVTADATGGLLSNASYTITLTNNSASDATLSFVYTVTESGRDSSAPSVKYYTTSSASGTTVSLSSGSTFKQTLQAGGKVVISVTTAKLGQVAVKLSNISLKIKTTANVTFAPNSAVSYTIGYVDGDGTSQTATVTAGTANNVTVEAELSEGFTITSTTSGYSCESATGSASGMVFVDGNSEFAFVKNETVTPVFISSSEPKPFTHLGNKVSYHTLNAAVNAGSGTVVLNQNYTLPVGDYTIPYGVTLLIPYDDANTLVTNGNTVLDAYDTTVTARSEYRSLKMKSGTSITVANGGALSVSSGRANQFIGQVGPYGAIYMDSGSNITVQSGGTLYTWGYIFHGAEGSGTVTAESGGTVYEPISIMDYPGSSSSAATITDNGVFPMRSYSVRNVEVPMTLNSGAKEYVFCCLWGSNPLVGTNPLYLLFAANGTVNDNTPVLQNTGTITKSYVNGRMRTVIDGNVLLNAMTVEVASSFGAYTISSSSTSGFYIPSCWDITLASGTATVNDKVIVCEGATFTINQGATVNTNGMNIYILDADDDPGAVGNITLGETTIGGGWNGCSIDVSDVHGNYYTYVPKDAVLDVNGTLIASGGFYTSSAGASIISSEGTGTIQVSGTSSSTSVNVKKTNDHAAVAITPAYLQHANGTYVQSTAATYYYVKGKWTAQDKVPDMGDFLTRIVLGDSLDVQFAFDSSLLSNAEGNYVTIYKDFADGRDYYPEAENKEYKGFKFTLDALETITIYGTQYYVVTFPDVSGKEMTDTITLTLVENGAEKVTYTDSIREYVLRIIDDQSSTTKTMLADLLHYGAAAQTYYSYGTDKLANAGLGNYAHTTTPPTIENSSNFTANSTYVHPTDGIVVSATTTFSRLELTNGFYLHFSFVGINRNMTAIATYKGDTYPLRVGTDGTTLYFTTQEVLPMSMADADETVIVKVYDKSSGSEVLVCTITDSIESYVYRVLNDNTTEVKNAELEALLQRIIMFSDSVQQYVEPWSGKEG